MIDSDRESNESHQSADDQPIVPERIDKVRAQRGPPTGVFTVTYDALDYRLMATFPASDATAQY